MASMSMNFNQNSEKSRFIYKPSPVNKLAFQIFENKIGYEDYTPVGNYIILDSDETPSISEQKLMNLITLMNGRSSTVPLGDKTGSTLYYQVMKKKLDSDPTKIIFRTRGKQGVSTENAILEIERGIFDA